MGADFIFQILPLAKLDDKRREQFKKQIDALTLDQLIEMRDSVFPGDDSAEDIKESLANVLDEYSDLMDRRDCGCLTLHGCQFILTGGMSWGDDPTNSHRTMEILSQIPGAWELLEAWSVEDRTKK